MTTAEIIEYYQGLLIVQYAWLGNALATIALMAGATIQNQIVLAIQSGFNLLTALSAQINVLGTFRNISRTLYGLTPGNDWSLVPALSAVPNTYFGWALAAGANPTWKWLQVNDLDNLPYTLTDIQMTKLIQLKAGFDSWDGTLGGMDQVLYPFFGANVTVIDNGNMTMTYQHLLSDPDPNLIFEIAKLAAILPASAGVLFTVSEV